MTTTADILPLTKTVEPAEQAELAAEVRAAHDERTAVYPLGGGTSLGFGLPAREKGIGVATTGLTRVVDYPARDMTITVEAGITIAALAEMLVSEGQRLPVDAPQASRATLGGLVATNFSGPRRYGFGTMRDYVIGISAVDGRGTLFKGGGRVVKNVAGYDFCKLLTGSLGTLGIITQVTLKVRPIPERSVLVSAGVEDLAQAEPLLAGLVASGTTPTAIELVSGPAWRGAGALTAGHAATIFVGLEGTNDEVAWMIGQLQREWADSSARDTHLHTGAEATALWRQLTEFPAEGNSPLVVHCSVRPSRVVELCSLIHRLDLPCSIQAHAGTGVTILRFEEFSANDISPVLLHQLQPAVARWDGRMKLLRADASLGDLPRQVVWGTRDVSVDVMTSVRRQFDPEGILNPGRFVY